MPVLISITPSVIDTPPDEPLPSMITLPLPFGNKLILPFDVDTISLLLTSRSPPSCGVESPATDARPPTELKTLSTVTFFRTQASTS